MADRDRTPPPGADRADRRRGERRLTLADRLRARIAAEGPIPLDAFMAACNAHYYATRDPLGAGGDFVTAPEVSQMFGELIGAWCADLWDRAGRPAAACVELGPGRGTLAVDALRAMRGAGLTPPVHFVETSPVLRAAQAERAPDAAWHETVDTLPEDRALLIVANEFFDALPVRQFVWQDGAWRERVVDWDGERFIPVLSLSPSREGSGWGLSPIPALSVRPRASTPIPSPEGKGCPDGTSVELRPAAAAIATTLAARIARQGGALLVIDYGHRQPASGDTLQAVRRHARADPFASPGEADLTAHVDFTALARAAAPLVASRIVDQGEWLLALGLAPRAAALARRAPDRAAEIATACRRLSAPEEMGALFKLLALTAPGWPAPAGF